MNDAKNKRIFAENLNRYMELRGITNQKLCDDLNFKYTTFMDWKKAVTYPRIGKIEAMANYFGCEKSDLIEEHDPEEQKKAAHMDGQTEEQRNLIEFAKQVPPDKAAMILRLAKSILEDD